VHRQFDEEYLDRVRAYRKTAAYEKAIAKRRVWVEPLFGEAKQWHGLARFRLRGLEKVNSESLLIATGQNVKRLLKKWGCGRRPGPNGAALAAGPGGQRLCIVTLRISREGSAETKKRWPNSIGSQVGVFQHAAPNLARGNGRASHGRTFSSILPLVQDPPA